MCKKKCVCKLAYSRLQSADNSGVRVVYVQFQLNRAQRPSAFLADFKRLGNFTVVNREFLSLCGGSHEIKLTVSLKHFHLIINH